MSIHDRESGERMITRRQFITRLAQAGGSAYGAMLALGLLETPPVTKFSLTGQVEGVRVIILGAGLAGLCAAYELGKLGYDCRLVEARARAGGRCWTVRRGSQETEMEGERQVAAFDEGLYFNPGPARIPHHHTTTLNYCRELGVAVEPFINVNESAYYYNERQTPLAGQKVRIRAARADLRGYAAELLAKAVRQDTLDTALTGEDKERLLDYLSREGGLTRDLRYQAGGRRGYSTPPGAGAQPGTVDQPYSLSDVLQLSLGYDFSPDYSPTQESTLFQIVGGTDNLAQAFEKQVSERIIYQAEVKQIQQSPAGVRIVYSDPQGESQVISGDFCICTIPLSVLRYIPIEVSQKLKMAIAAVGYVPTGKIGLQFSRRFWEEDEGIYGGISLTDTAITQIWYPSSGYLSARGILVGYYNFGPAAAALGQFTPAQREAYALAEGRKIHPQYDDTFETAFSVSWHKLKYSRGGWAFYDQLTRAEAYPRLTEPDGRISLAGEHASYLTGWMAGALESAQRVVTALHQRVLNG